MEKTWASHVSPKRLLAPPSSELPHHVTHFLFKLFELRSKATETFTLDKENYIFFSYATQKF